MAEVPETRFAKLGNDRIAYQVVGEGPPDLLWLTGLGEPIDARWEFPPCASFIRRLASFSRLIMLDRRGVGASDPASSEALPRWEGWADDAMAVLDAVGSERATIMGASQGGPAAIMFAATRPERTQALILVNTVGRIAQADDYPWGITPEELEAAADFVAEHWGTEAAASFGNPGQANNPVFRRWMAKMARLACSGREMATYMRQDSPTDVRQVLPSIQVPTLVLHRNDTPFFTVDQGRYLAEHIPGARFVSVPGADIAIYTKPNAQILAEIEEFITGGGPSAGTDRALAAVLFTDIVGSTERAAALGDRRWTSLLGSHDVVAQAIIDQHGGRLVKLTGDGVLATFDGPGRAIRCGFALRDALDPLGITIRAGLHTGEVELRGDDIGGIGVHVAGRVLEHAEPGELLVSAAVPLLVAGSGVEFEDRGEYELKGVPETWRLYAVEG
jgi:pimeloyl-ACP methyl ester carboxylesterase